MDQKPTIALTVHYVSYGTPGGEYASQCRAAIVTEVGELPENAPWMEPVGLCVLNPTGLFFNDKVFRDEARLDDGRVGAGGTWHHICGN